MVRFGVKIIKNKSKLEVIEILPLIDASEKRTGYIMLAMLAK